MPLLQSHVALLLQLPLLLLITNTAKLVSSRPSAPHCRLHRRAHRGSESPSTWPRAYSALTIGRPARLISHLLSPSPHQPYTLTSDGLCIRAPGQLHSCLATVCRHSLLLCLCCVHTIHTQRVSKLVLKSCQQHKYGRTSCQAPGENDAHLVRTTHVLAETHAHAKTPYLHSAAAPHLFCVATPLTHAVTAATTTATATATTTANRTRQSHTEPNTSA